MDTEQNKVVEEIYYMNSISRTAYNFLNSLMFIGLITIISMLSLESDIISTGIVGVSSFFIGISIILAAVALCNWWGVVSTLIGSILFGIGLKYDLLTSLLWSLANIIQALLFKVFLWWNSRSRKHGKKEDNKKKPYKTAGLTFILVTLIMLITAYLIGYSISLLISMGILLIVYAIYWITNKDNRLMKVIGFMLLISLIGALYGVSFSMKETIFASGWTLTFFTTLYTSGWLINIYVWTVSNTIILSSIGIFIVWFIQEKRNPDFITDEKNTRRISSKRPVNIRLDSILYAVSLTTWNFLFVVLYITNWFDYGFSILYLSAWALGFLFFSANYVLSRKKELIVDEKEILDENKKKELFQFIEKRAVVTEENTGTIILVLSILIPVAGSLLGTLTIPLITVFIITITVACASIGLIWIPQGNIRLMSIIKTVKTILHLFTICFLLLGAILLLDSII